MSAPRRWLVYACRTDYTTEVVEIVRRLGDEIAALVDNLEDAQADPGAGIIPAAGLDAAALAQPAVVPLLTPGYRFTAVEQARGQGITSFPALLDPTAVVASSAEIAEGAVVNAAAVLAGESRVRGFAHVNRSASVGHHSVVDAFATLGPGCVLAGRVHVGSGAFVGAGAVCAPKVRIGENAVVGAGAVVVRDVAPGAVVVGNPAKVLREGDTGYGGARVPT